MILTARESEKLRDEIIQYGISQIDGGTKIEIGSYVEKEKNHNLNKGQFKINDDALLMRLSTNCSIRKCCHLSVPHAIG